MSRADRIPWRKRRYGAVLLCALLVAVACAPHPRRLLVLHVAAPATVGSYEDLVALAMPDLVPRVAALVADTFGAPLPEELRLGLYRTRGAFTEGLVHDIGLSPRLALELSGNAVGFALPRTVLLLTGEAGEDRVRLVAHEVMHVIQLELAGPGARPAHWIMEGTAEWGALTVLARLGAPGIDARMAVARAIGVSYLADHPRFSLAAVRRPADFRRWQGRAGDLTAYQVSYALAEQLVALHGFSAVMGYFRAYRQGGDDVKNFQRAFGSSPEEFMAAARMAMRAVPRPTS